MVVCRYFLENKCRFGENCRNEHPRGDVQRSLFGLNKDAWGKSRVTFGNNDSQDSSRDRFKWVANSNQQSQNTLNQNQPVDPVNNLPREIEVWEKSKMWPFSCISIEKDIPSLPGLYDISVEELRLEAYQALKSGNTQPYMERFQSLVTDFGNKKQQLKHLTPETKQKLVAFLEEMRKKKSGSSQGMGGFSQNSQGLFGKATGSSAPNPFAQTGQQLGVSAGAGLFGKPTSSSTPFGSTAAAGNSSSSGSVFGGNTSSFSGGSAFANTSAGLFGKGQQDTTSNPFASTSPTGGGPSLFGGNSAASQQAGGGMMGGAASNVFMNSNNNNNNATGSSAPQSLFGKPVGNQMSGTGSVFGSAPAQPGLFSPAGQANQGQGLLGAAPNKPFGGSAFSSQSAKPGLLGAAPAGLFSSPTAGGGGVGGSGGLQPAAGQQTLFGKPVAAASTSVLPQPGLFSTGPVASASAGLPGAAVSSSSTSASDVNPGRYTPLDQLTESEKAEFSAPAFTLGKIPLHPPPKELINI